ncbi:MAG: HNH endonuclease, partial [Terriglobia bacterium]
DRPVPRRPNRSQLLRRRLPRSLYRLVPCWIGSSVHYNAGAVMKDAGGGGSLNIDRLDLSPGSKSRLKEKGFSKLEDFQGVFFPDLYEDLSFEQAKKLLKVLLLNHIEVRFSQPDWTEEDWHRFIERLVSTGIVTWREVALAVCGELNPPQVGTAIASNKSFQAKFPPRQTMKNVMAWFYAQSGRCTRCGTRLFLEADHIRSKQEYAEADEDPEEADRLENLQLLCKRCNVIKRPSHELGGISFAPAQSILMWILLNLKPKARDEFYDLCRQHGLTMANIRFDEAWALAEWLKKEGKYG